VHEHILAAIIWTDEAITLLGVEPFDGADSQERSPIKNFDADGSRRHPSRGTGRVFPILSEGNRFFVAALWLR
jgi:hypothetical protein